ncbi:inner-membrane translocator [Ferroglobus placidus DSM 10642]|uniref:Inner-membrane translocator n=1 Tax=Ferroglobus placidus (strain DSM 10642 / AEDII12DO) TaxID=589924 RepID=D3S0N8_FERPA|nr:branched-chain amino acid ABC transporter permease [Ferroglobus placidus]ADC66279.1 inner-membrane translocator [Ferroglobus placidus DSM 10642]
MSVVEGAIIYSNLLVLLSMSLTITYITTSVPNFAQGSFAVFGSYLAFAFFKLFEIHPYKSIPLVFILGGFLGIATYFLVLRPLIKKEASVLILMIATLAWDLILLGFLGIFSETLGKIIGGYASRFIFTPYDFRAFGMNGIFFVSSAAIILCLFGLAVLFYKTKFGIALRASMENPQLAEVMGVNVEYTRIFSWFLSGSFSALAGALLPFKQEIVQSTGALIIVSIFAASIVGGLSSILGAILGGYLIGISETLVTFYLSKLFGTGVLVYSKLVPLVILIVVLLYIPQGLVSIRWSKWRWSRH